MKKILFLFILIVSSNLAFSQKIVTDSLVKEKFISTSSKEFKDLAIEVDSLKKFRNDYEPTLKNSTTFLGTLLGGGVLLALFLWFLKLPKKINLLLEDYLAKHLTDRRDTIVKIIDDSDAEKKAIQSKNISLVSRKGSDDSRILSKLKKHGFKISQTFTGSTTIADIKGIDKDSVVFINNEDSQWSSDEIANFINSIENYCFYFGSGLIKLEEERKDKFAAANMRTQVVGNLINMLKYN